MFLDISLPEKLIGKSHRPQNKTFIRGASPGVSDELWDKNAIGGRRLDVATQERKVCKMEIEIVTFTILNVTLSYQLNQRTYKQTNHNAVNGRKVL